MRTYAKSCVRRKSFYRKSELQMLMLSLFSGGHICVSKLYTNMASPYKVYNGAWNVSANNSETVGHIDLRLVKLFIYQSFVTLHFLGFFHWTVFNLFFCAVFIVWQWNGIDWRASATSSPWDEVGGCAPVATNADYRLAGKPQGGGGYSHIWAI